MIKKEGFRLQLMTQLKLTGLKSDEILTKLEVSKERMNELLDGCIPTVVELEKICLLSGTDIYSWLNVILNDKVNFLTSHIKSLLDENDEDSIVKAFIFGKILLIDDIFYERYMLKINKLDSDTVKKALKILFKYNVKLAKKFSTKEIFLTYDDLKDYPIKALYEYIIYSSVDKKDSLSSLSKTFNPFIKTCPVDIKVKLLEMLYNDILEFNYHILNKAIKKDENNENIYYYNFMSETRNYFGMIDLNYDFGEVLGCKDVIDKIKLLLTKMKNTLELKSK